MDHLGKVFSIIHRTSAAHMEKALKALGVPYGQFMFILCICDHEGFSQEQLAAELKMDKGFVARTVKNLEQQGFVRRMESPDDRRQKILFPTEKSKRLYPKITGVIQQQEQYLTKNLSDIEKDLLRSLLDKVREGL